MTTSQIFAGCSLKAPLPPGIAEMHVAGLEYDSRRVEPGYLFFAFPGQHADGRRFASDALSRGALAVVSESARPESFAGPWVEVEHGRRSLALAARRFHGAPDERVAITGITGTNGKTTAAFILDSIFRAAGKTTLVIGTIEYQLAGRTLPAANTTPESLDIFRLLERLEAEGGTHATMEVSSHALSLGRASGIQFHAAVFTNLTRDHLDFHGGMQEYFHAKESLFRAAPAPRFAVVNRDDEWGRKLETHPETETITYGLSQDAALRASHVSSSARRLHFEVRYKKDRFEVESRLIGRINVYNILAACGAAIANGVDPQTIAEGIARCAAVPGRFERVDAGQPFLVVVDYAHTDDALRNTIAVARGLSPKRVITLFGCGGDRDRTKRPLMAQAAAELSDFVVLTSDNPRSEDPIGIMNDALVGLRRSDVPHAIEPDRAKAIRRAIEEARPGDLVLLAGKGHETYQVLKDRTIHFDDRETAREALQEFGYSRRAS
ncbi:MAG: UDP-N-acetylmuramoyl-L-alanyl-D-glutamate--2,6-diaminopimelate ligase [Bryobacterales bacterium]|nr:UDP-N-acetylmuramoyl-L-alanyl-D-glutamate--2,6-diaminopimelate ligase [Bryobacterales bacterium]